MSSQIKQQLVSYSQSGQSSHLRLFNSFLILAVVAVPIRGVTFLKSLEIITPTADLPVPVAPYKKLTGEIVESVLGVKATLAKIGN